MASEILRAFHVQEYNRTPLEEILDPPLYVSYHSVPGA